MLKLAYGRGEGMRRGADISESRAGWKGGAGSCSTPSSSMLLSSETHAQLMYSQYPRKRYPHVSPSQQHSTHDISLPHIVSISTANSCEIIFLRIYRQKERLQKEPCYVMTSQISSSIFVSFSTTFRHSSLGT